MMLKYLVNFGVDANLIDEASSSINDDIDITDITQLEGQINKARKTHNNLLKTYDSLQEEYLNKKAALSAKIRNINMENVTRTERQDAMATDIEYMDIVDSIEAIKEAMRMVGNQIDFIKSDIRILSNSMYRKY